MAGRAAVGLDIGTSGVRAAELSLGKGSVTLERFGQVALPPGAVRDGEVVDSAVVAEAIKRLWNQVKFSSKKVVVGVSNQRVVVRQADLPWLPAAEMKKSLPFQVQDFIPMPVDQALLDYHPLEEFTNDSGVRMMKVLLVAASREMVGSALESVQEAGLTPVMVDLTPFAVMRALVVPDELGLAPAEAEALVNIGASVTNIVVHEGGIPRFVRILLMGGADITEAVADRMGVPVEQAESVKQTAGMSLTAGVVDDHPASRVIESTAGQLVEEIRGSLDYYLAQGNAVRIRRLVLSGGGAQLTGLQERLGAATRLPVHAATAMELLKVGKTGLSAEQLSYVEPLVAVPVGLALGAA